MSKNKLDHHDGYEDRRQGDPSVYWVNEQVPGRCQPNERRLDADSRRVLTNLLKLVYSRDAVGLVFGVLNQNGTLDIGMSGKLYDDPVLVKWVAHRLDELARDLPNHPDQA